LFFSAFGWIFNSFFFLPFYNSTSTQCQHINAMSST
jgi:hypothetical protein